IGLCRGRFEDRNVELLAGEQGRDPELQLAFDPDVLVRGARKGGYTITGSRGPNRGRRGASTPGIPCMLMRMKPTERARKFWRVIAAALGVLLSASVFANFVSAETVPSAVTLLLFGSLVAVGVGNTIVNPRSSPVMLTEHEQASFRRRQRNVGFAFSLVLGLG